MFGRLSDQDLFGFIQLKEKEGSACVDFEDEIILEAKNCNLKTKEIFLKKMSEQEVTYHL